MIWIESYPSKGPAARGFLGFHKETKSPDAMARKDQNN
jgi:hypothetical protein